MPRCEHCTDSLGKKKKFVANQFCQHYCLESEECIAAWIADKKKGKAKSFEVKVKSDTKILREKIKTKSDYEKDLQKLTNTIVREIDRNSICHSTLKPLNDKFDAGHVFSVGANPTLRFNLFNIYSQSVHANQYLSGDQINFLEGLSHLYGENHKEHVLGLKRRFKSLKLSQDELKEKILIARHIVKELKAMPDTQFLAHQRIDLRTIYNEKLGIYTESYAIAEP